MIQIALRLGVEIPSYRRAADAYDALVKVSLSKSTLQKLVEEYGTKIEKGEAQEADRLSEPAAAKRIDQEQPEPDGETMAVSMDGVMVHIREEGWKEVKVAAISAVEQKVVGDEAKVHLHKHSYCAGLWEAKEFAKRQWAEAWRRGLEKAKQVVSVNDGAVWIWSLVKTCYTPCVEIIDWWHAVEHLWEIVHVFFREDAPEAKIWAETLKTLLWNGQIRSVIAQVRERYTAEEPFPDTLCRMLRYFIKHRHRMKYADYRGAGYPVGSGTVESACKTVVQERICQAGMRWSRSGLQAMLALRCNLLSDRWHDALASPSRVRASP